MSEPPQKVGRKVWYWVVFWFSPKRGAMGEITVERQAVIPQKFRKEGYEGILDWTNEKGQKQKYKVRMVKKGDDEFTLKSTSVNCKTGHLNPPGTRAFSAQVMAERRENQTQKRKDNKALKKGVNSLVNGLTLPPLPIAAAQHGCSGASFPSNSHISSIQFNRTALSNQSSSQVPSLPFNPQASSNHFNSQVPSLPFNPSMTSMQFNSSAPQGSPQMIPFTSPVSATHHSSEDTLANTSDIVMEVDDHLADFCSWAHIDFLKELLVSLEKGKNSSYEKKVVNTFVKLSLKRIQTHAESKVSQNGLPPKIVSMPIKYKTFSESKTEMFPGIYFDSDEVSEVEIRMDATTDEHWQKYVDLVLSIIYKEDLKWLTAVGKGGTKGINKDLSLGLYMHVQTKMNVDLPKKDFNQHINKLCANRRASAAKKEINQSTPKAPRVKKQRKSAVPGSGEQEPNEHLNPDQTRHEPLNHNQDPKPPLDGDRSLSSNSQEPIIYTRNKSPHQFEGIVSTQNCDLTPNDSRPPRATSTALQDPEHQTVRREFSAMLEAVEVAMDLSNPVSTKLSSHIKQFKINRDVPNSSQQEVPSQMYNHQRDQQQNCSPHPSQFYVHPDQHLQTISPHHQEANHHYFHQDYHQQHSSPHHQVSQPYHQPQNCC